MADGLSMEPRLYRFAGGIAYRVLTTLPRGRAATWFEAAQLLTYVVGAAGPGDHLEIGTLHGATAIMAALIKDAVGDPGQVVVIDPLEGFYPAQEGSVVSERGDVITAATEPHTGVPVTPEVFWANVGYYGVRDRIELVQAYSQPWPVELIDRHFISAYIDGNHYHEGPKMDWWHVSGRIDPGGWVVFDDANENCPGVLAACEEADNHPYFVSHGTKFGQLHIMERAHPVESTP